MISPGSRGRRRPRTFRRSRPRKPARPSLVPVLAILGTLLAAFALPVKAFGLHQVAHALEQIKPEARDARLESLLFAAAGHPLAVANGMLLVGGALIIFAFVRGTCRERWFLWTSLALGLTYLWQPFWGTLFALLCLHRVALAWKWSKPPAVREVILIPE
ncbi:MAG: hypothetical protein KGS60_10460 [Verrucomicrobia bacterium]|nr:hypothetical protein [Verrucomicrobiota bacterium]